MERYPAHVAIILDGNRRYGERMGNKLEGHLHGAKKVEQLIEWCQELKIKELTLYSFSLDNFNRSALEKKALFDLFRHNIDRLKNEERFRDNTDVKIAFIGRIGLFPKDIHDDMLKIMDKTKENTKFQVNFAMAYSSKGEIVDALKAIIDENANNKIPINEIDEQLIEKHLYLPSKPDIFIRPGGEKRMSDFLLWQSAYAELMFLDKLWPEFSKEDLIGCIEEFRRRERRFGK